MYFSIILGFFILGTIFGSFYNVVGYRVPKKESIITPSSHCTNCNHKLTSMELIPVLSYLFLRGKCKKCKCKISSFYTIFELITGLLFALSYMVFGLSLECLFSITFVSMLVIIVISDYQTMIIPDEVLIVFSILLIIEKFFISGLSGVGLSVIHGLISFGIMFLIKLFGDFLFKKESMGGGDIKLLGVFGFVFGVPLSIISIFLASIIGLPISLALVRNKSNHEVPFGPFLALASVIILFSKIDISTIINLLNW